MKLLLTGAPRGGKTTLLKDLLRLLPAAHGFITEEIKTGEEPVGFRVVASSGQLLQLAGIDSKSPVRVSRYGVNVTEFDAFMESFPAPSDGVVFYLDEIGQMQLYSHLFRAYVRERLDAPHDYLGTISAVYDDPFIHAIRSRGDILLIEVTPENREELRKALLPLVMRLNTLRHLPPAVQEAVTFRARWYAERGDYLRLCKLFKNAVKYLAGGRILTHGPNAFEVSGDHGKYHVRRYPQGWTCECDLFAGRGAYEGKGGECSHIQAAILFLAK